MIQIITSILVLASVFLGTPGVAGAITKDIVHAKIIASGAAGSYVSQPMTLPRYVREYYKDTPLLYEIAKCESDLRQFGKDGQVIRGEVDRDDVGIMQINERYHGERALSLGYDLRTLSGNMAYAKILYSDQGVKPWVSSLPCWNNSGTEVAVK